VNKWTVVTILTAALLLTAFGCNNNSADPVTPENPADMTRLNSNSAPAHLWGYFDVYLNTETGEIEVVPNRTVMGVEPSPFNVVDFMNKSPLNLKFDINEIVPPEPVKPSIEVDIDVGITHPFSGLPAYNGYDVKGIFIGNGSSRLAHNGLSVAEPGVDQFMGVPPTDDYTPPDPCFGNPDGYTRWWNPDEFGLTGILGYTKGIFASEGYIGDANLNPFKYFSDEIGPTDKLEDIVGVVPPDDQVPYRTFSSGKTNYRNYFLSFPTPDPNVKFNYAVLAHWQGEDIHPALGPEAVGVVTVTIPDLWYVDESNNGGDIVFDLAVIVPDDDVVTEIFVESKILTEVYQFTEEEMRPIIDGFPHMPTYHTEIPADNLTHSGMTEFWIMLQYEGNDYENDMGQPNEAWSDTLTSYYRHNLYIADKPYNQPPVVDRGVEGDATPFFLGESRYTVAGHDDDGDPLSYSWTLTDSGGTVVSGYDGVPGNGDGTIDIDWSTTGAVPDDEFDVDCDIEDDKGGSSPADTLTVTCDNILFEDNMESGEGDWLTSHSGDPSNSGWEIVTGGNDGHWWHSTGGASSLYQPDCAQLYTPEITIPAGVSSCDVEIYHSQRGYFWSNTISQGGICTISYNDGTTYARVNPPVTSGPNYDNWSYPYGSTYHWALVNACGSPPGGGWGWAIFCHNSSPVTGTSVLDYSSQIGQTGRIGFIYASYWYNGNYFWGIDDIKITVDP